MIDISAFINQFLLPQHCLLCGARGGALALCADCRADLPWHNAATACPRCGAPEPQGQPCGQCVQHPPHFDTTLAVFDFSFPVDALLRRYKYRGYLAVAGLAGALLAERVCTGTLPQCVIPMPLHPDRLRERGFNQALEIARIAARRLDLPLLPRAAERTRPTVPQTGLPRDKRQRNLRDAFVCHAGLESQHVALVDDVMTTGASLDALATAVRAAGAARVDCWVVARTDRR